MKKILLIILLFGSVLYGQEKEFIVVDIDTNLPISNVHMFYSELNEGAISNENGKAKILIKDTDLLVTHINYNKLTVSKNQIKVIDTIKLTSKVNLLDEINITKVNLKKKLQYVMDNFEDLYINYPTEKECSFKETFLVDNEYKRLFLAQIRWWSASSSIKYKRKYGKSLKLKLSSIDYNKSEAVDFFKSNDSGAITTSSLVNFFYLNHAINSLTRPGYLEIDAVIKLSDKDVTIVSYETDWKEVKGEVKIRNTGEITFDNETQAIVHLTKNIEYKNRVTSQVNKETNDTHKIEYKNNSFEYGFVKNSLNKWSLKYFNTSINIELTYNEKLHQLDFSNSLYVLKEFDKKKVNNKGIMDMKVPIYKNLPAEKILNSNSVLLSEKEKEFLYED